MGELVEGAVALPVPEDVFAEALDLLPDGSRATLEAAAVKHTGYRPKLNAADAHKIAARLIRNRREDYDSLDAWMVDYLRLPDAQREKVEAEGPAECVGEIKAPVRNADDGRLSIADVAAAMGVDDDAEDDAPPEAAPEFSLTLTDGQETARQEILKAAERATFTGVMHCLEGYAGTGKTTLMQVVVRDLQAMKMKVAVTSPTNKATSVLERKMAEAGVTVKTSTIYSLLGLTPGSDDEKRKPKRVGKNKAPAYQAVVIDECSMISSDIMAFIKKDLRNHFVLFIGDPAQLPPVGERLSQTFQVPGKSTLTQIVRQGDDNPIIELSKSIRSMQAEGIARWEEFHERTPGGPIGIFRPPAEDAMAWIEQAFLSEEFERNNDRFRFLAWTNKRVTEINRRIRHLVYGDTPTPFIEGERVLVRSSITSDAGEPLIHTNDEAVVTSIRQGMFKHSFDAHEAGTTKDGKPLAALRSRTLEFPVWQVELETHDGTVVPTQIAQDAAEYERLCGEIRNEARANHRRWREFFDMTEKVARLQSVYAMTVHCSQGSTFENVFVDVGDCARNGKTIEILQLMYVAVTRPSHALILV